MDLFGFADFKRETGCDNTRLRIMESTGVIRPARTPSGWRVFTWAEIETARAWMAENGRMQERA
jgi:hypothetical protein